MLFIGNIAGKNGAVDSFCMASVKAAKAIGLSYYIAANFSQTTVEKIQEDEAKYDVSICQIDFARNPLNPQNIRAYKQLVKLIQDEKIDYIHCNTPVGGLLGRNAGRKCKVKKIIYQTHGFHFYKGAPKLNWILYYPIERWLAHYTDALITINKEDYELAKNKFKLRNGGKVYYVPGVGIDTSLYKLDDNIRTEKRNELHIPLDAFVLLSVGELNENKNNRVIIKALERLKEPNLHYILCGVGEQEKALQEQANKANLQSNVHFLGYRTDVKEIYAMSDCFVLPSYREGLSRSLMEAMASGLPCIVSKIRGNVDLIDDKGGYCCDVCNDKEFTGAIKQLFANKNSCRCKGRYNQNKVQKYNIENVKHKLCAIYQNIAEKE